MLGGRVVEQGPENSKVKKGLGCGIEHLSGFPTDPRTILHIDEQQAQEIVWEVAETNFCYEPLVLDHRASGMNRPDSCWECLVGGMLVSILMEHSWQGFAAAALSDRHMYNVCLARLMSDWKASLPSEVRCGETWKSWSMGEMQALEDAVATVYCQAFYDYFERTVDYRWIMLWPTFSKVWKSEKGWETKEPQRNTSTISTPFATCNYLWWPIFKPAWNKEPHGFTQLHHETIEPLLIYPQAFTCDAKYNQRSTHNKLTESRWVVATIAQSRQQQGYDDRVWTTIR
ncbi:hypothetical protein B0H14DRAFT_2599280 [Mycena olivaceomarginata]|nr:hypothetical protein B0H14DRAFT_2599280 [Mycena olivaceomarginata]